MLLDNIYDVNLTTEYCEIWFPAGRTNLYRLVKIYHIILAAVSMLSIIYFLLKFRNFLTFHFNVKILFFFQFAACFVHAADLGIAQTHHLIASLLAVEPCDIVIPKYLYAILNVPLIFSMICIESSTCAMVIERTIASCLFRCYEKAPKKIGFGLLVLTIFHPIGVVGYIYFNETFTKPQMVVLATTPISTSKVNEMFTLNIVFLLISLFHSVGLYKNNQRRDAVSAQGNMRLSSRYQLSENVTSSRLLWHISMAQLLIYLFYAFSMYALRIIMPGERDYFWQSITELFYTPPIYCAVMPLICLATIRRAQKERNLKISSMLQMRATGSEGWSNYQNMLQKQWA